MSALNPRVEALLEEQSRHAAVFEPLVRSLTPAELSEPVPDTPWTVRDYVAHLCTIEALINVPFSAMSGITDVPPPDVPSPQPFDIDDWNHAIVRARVGRSIDELLVERSEHRERYVRALSAMGDTQLDMQIPFGGDRKVIDLPLVMIRLEELLWGIAIHDPMHTDDILRALPERREELSHWLDSVDRSRISAEIQARRA
jgi:hypothetical protein